MGSKDLFQKGPVSYSEYPANLGPEEIHVLETFQKALKNAMLAKDTAETSVIRAILTAYKNEVVAKSLGPNGTLTEIEVVQILKRMVKQRQDSVEQFRKGGREELATLEEREIQILNQFLPSMLTEHELTLEIDEILKETGITQKKQMGLVMKTLVERFGAGFEGRLASTILSSKLI